MDKATDRSYIIFIIGHNYSLLLATYPQYQALVPQGGNAFMKQFADEKEFKAFIYALYEGAARNTISHIVESRHENNFQAIIDEAFDDAFRSKNDPLRIELIALASSREAAL